MARVPSSVVLVAGHLIDLPGRALPRFPPSEVDRVRADIDQAFSAWHVGPGLRVFCGGARGADLLAAEAALERGADVTLLLALPPDRFVQRSVRIAPGDPGGWAERFHRVAPRSRLCVLDAGAAGEDPFERCNRRLLERAMGSARGALRILLVWDGRPGDGRGGTAHLSELVAVTGATIEVVDPRPLAPRP